MLPWPSGNWGQHKSSTGTFLTGTRTTLIQRAEVYADALDLGKELSLDYESRLP